MLVPYRHIWTMMMVTMMNDANNSWHLQIVHMCHTLAQAFSSNNSLTFYNNPMKMVLLTKKRTEKETETQIGKMTCSSSYKKQMLNDSNSGRIIPGLM